MPISINMKKQFVETVKLPEGVSAHWKEHTLTVTKGSQSASRILTLPLHTALKSEGDSVSVTCTSGNKKSWASIRALVAHIHNLSKGVQNSFVYELEICNVHFPMTVKVEGTQFVVTNFLGEKQKRSAFILPHVNVEVKGTKVIVSSTDIEAAGQTAANIERATHVTKRDRRIFQDGIFITSKNGRAI